MRVGACMVLAIHATSNARLQDLCVEEVQVALENYGVAASKAVIIQRLEELDRLSDAPDGRVNHRPICPFPHRSHARPSPRPAPSLVHEASAPPPVVAMGGCYGRLLWVVAMGGCYGWLLWVVALGGCYGWSRSQRGQNMTSPGHPCKPWNLRGRMDPRHDQPYDGSCWEE